MLFRSSSVKSGSPTTVVAYGKNANLKTTAFTDDLTQPGDGKARLRLVQAATAAKSVNVRTSTGTDIATAQAAAYRGVDALDFPSGFCRRDIGWRELTRRLNH